MRALAVSVRVLTVSLVGIAAGCDARPSPDVRAAPSARPAVSHARPDPLRGTRAGVLAVVPEIERMTGGARFDEPAPLIVALHGLGDSPAGFVDLFDDFPARARLSIPHSTTTFGHGYSWFALHQVGSDVDAPGIAAMADAIAAFATDLAAHRPTLGKPIVTGFSQGGALSFAIAARHPDAIAVALPIGGWLPPSLAPTKAPNVAPPVFAFHGTDDGRVPIAEARAAAARLSPLTYSVNLREFDGVGHAIPPVVRTAWFDALTAACAGAAR